MGKKIAVFYFFSEEINELKERFQYLERHEKENLQYHFIPTRHDIEEILKNNNYKEVYISSVKVFEDIEEFRWFSEVVLGNGADYFIDEDGINSKKFYTVGAILEKIGNCFI